MAEPVRRAGEDRRCLRELPRSPPVFASCSTRFRRRVQRRQAVRGRRHAWNPLFPSHLKTRCRSKIGAVVATGWAPEGGVLSQIEDTITDGVSAARARIPSGEGAAQCVDCGDDIPEARRRALPGARTCVKCQSERDRRIVTGGINRRGSKDSQLR